MLSGGGSDGSGSDCRMSVGSKIFHCSHSDARQSLNSETVTQLKGLLFIFFYFIFFLNL